MSQQHQERMVQRPGLTIQKYGRFWAVYDQSTLVVVTVYKKGALEVIQRLEIRHDSPSSQEVHDERSQS
jgi:hypothetical protein